MSLKERRLFYSALIMLTVIVTAYAMGRIQGFAAGVRHEQAASDVHFTVTTLPTGYTGVDGRWYTYMCVAAPAAPDPQ